MLIAQLESAIEEEFVEHILAFSAQWFLDSRSSDVLRIPRKKKLHGGKSLARESEGKNYLSFCQLHS